MSKFVPSDVKTLKLKDGDTIVVKKFLNSGEERAAFG